MDSVAIITALGLLMGLITGGELVGYGAQAGLVIRSGADIVIDIGITPITIWDAPAIADVGLSGITLGGTTLVLPKTWYDTPYATRQEDGSYTVRYYEPGTRRTTLSYEFGHREFWGAYGWRYPIEILAHPCDYDPGWAGWLGCYGWTPEYGFHLPRRAYEHYTPPITHYALHYALVFGGGG